ncbi:MAG: S8 family serine peptidase [Bacteroidota bacterium]
MKMKSYKTKKYLVMIAAMLICSNIFAAGKLTRALSDKISNAKSGEKILVWVSFTDKSQEIGKYTVQPEILMSHRALLRRSKVATSSLIDDSDLPVSSEYMKLLKEKGFEAKRVSRWLNSASGFVTAGVLEEISALPFVKQIDVVRRYKNVAPVELQAAELPRESVARKMNYSLNYGASLTQLEQINVPAVHDMGLHGEGVVIGVFDAGFDNLAHEAFSQMNILAKYDFVNNDTNVGNQTDMGEGSHGTGTLSTIGGFKEGTLIGPAFKSSYILAKTENTNSETPVEEDNWIAALEWADSIGVDVTSTSLGYLDYDYPFTSYTWQNMDGKTARITVAADLAVKKGIVVVNSAGNEGFNSQHNTLGAPADGDSVISVGAVNLKGTRVDFSSVGPTVDGRIKPDIMAMGSGVVTADSYGNNYSFASGTSFSCPLAAGVAALIVNANPAIKPMQVRDAMRLTASKASSPDNQYGWGILDAKKAVEYARNITTVTGKNSVPEKFYLQQNYPNPFNPATSIRFDLPEKSMVSLDLYDILGRRIAVLLNGYFDAGEHVYRLNAASLGLSSGIYFVRLEAGNYTGVIKIVMNK